MSKLHQSRHCTTAVHPPSVKSMRWAVLDICAGPTHITFSLDASMSVHLMWSWTTLQNGKMLIWHKHSTGWRLCQSVSQSICESRDGDEMQAAQTCWRKNLRRNDSYMLSCFCVCLLLAHTNCPLQDRLVMADSVKPNQFSLCLFMLAVLTELNSPTHIQHNVVC